MEDTILSVTAFDVNAGASPNHYLTNMMRSYPKHSTMRPSKAKKILYVYSDMKDLKIS
jgi:hypothetical protein